jgi:hypothetical protein
MIILAIDPGNEESGYVVWDGNTILDKGKVENTMLLEQIQRGMTFVDGAVIEMVASYGMAVGQTVFNTCVWIGRFQQSIINRGIKPELVFRKDVKLFWCGQTRAKDSNISQAIRDRFGEKGSKKNGFNKTYNDEHTKMKADIWQAFALGVYAFDENVVI